MRIDGVLPQCGKHSKTYTIDRKKENIKIIITNGQFGWIEAETGLPITTAVADLLVALSWQKRARALADSLAAGGVLRSAVWRAAVEQTPRHLFVPASIDVTDTGMTTQEVCADAWLDRVYSDVTLVVQRRLASSPPTVDRPGTALPTSSSTMPSLMVEMLGALDVRDGHRVLEIGTGTGYNAALLSHRLGAENVFSIDIDPDLVHAAG